MKSRGYNGPSRGVTIGGVALLRNEAVAHLERDEPVPAQMLPLSHFDEQPSSTILSLVTKT